MPAAPRAPSRGDCPRPGGNPGSLTVAEPWRGRDTSERPVGSVRALESDEVTVSSRGRELAAETRASYPSGRRAASAVEGSSAYVAEPSALSAAKLGGSCTFE